MTQRRVHPVEDTSPFAEVEWRGITIQIKKKFPMFGFMRALDRNPIQAMSMIMSEESLEELDNVDMDFDDLNDFIGVVSKALGTKDAGN